MATTEIEIDEQIGDMEDELTVDEYQSMLAGGGGPDGTWESPIPGEFLKDDEGIWFVRGGGQCVAANGFHQWHTGMDIIYAVGSQISAGLGVSQENLQEARDLLQSYEDSPDITASNSPKDLVHLNWMIELCDAALQAEPSDEVQYVGDL